MYIIKCVQLQGFIHLTLSSITHSALECDIISVLLWNHKAIMIKYSRQIPDLPNCKISRISVCVS